MGVHGLWSILESQSLPVRLESLSRKKMAVDASIWIYQFLKAVRGKDGHSLRASHVVGFFRRICKLLFFGILPVFVFDGGAPALKREVIRRRKERRQGQREGAERTAQKLLALQLQRAKEAGAERPRDGGDGGDGGDAAIQYKYLGNEGEAVKPAAQFRSTDEYDLPHIEGFQMSKDDRRFVTEDDIKTYNEQMVDELEGIDLNTLDPASEEFAQLPLTTQYMALSQLRLRSRLRMGYTKEQLEGIFPESMDFSKFQIQMVQRRNYFTQRLMGISGMDDGNNNGGEAGRVAGERDRRYRIEKTDGGWALSLNDDTGSSIRNPVVLDKNDDYDNDNGGEDEDDDVDWEDVELEDVQEKKVNMSMSSLPLPPSTTVSAGDSTLKSFYSPTKKKSTERREDLHEDLKAIEEMELIEAIEQSKRDYTREKELELQMLKDQDDLFDGIPFDIEPAPEQESRREPELKERFDEAFPSTLPIPKRNPPLVSMGSSAKGVLEKDKLLLLAKGKKEQGLDEAEVEGESVIAKEKEDNPLVTVHSWLKGDSMNSYQRKQQAAIDSRQKEDNDKRKDEQLGLVSWSEAQEMLNSGGGDADEIEIVEQRVVDPEKSIAQESSVKAVEEATEEAPREQLNESVKEAPPTNEVDAEERAQEQRSPAAFDYEFEEEEEQELNEQLAKEEEEHEQFQRDLNPHIMAFLDNEGSLKKQHQREMRDADEVTVVMIREVQDLLSRFGIPYITAPMEAEAQCAELLKLKLVDGIITDDSDVFLFGGDRVYRNMFHEKHYVEFYNSNALEKLGLDRSKLIELAHLLGSDYTVGLKGIGPVLAMEILANFGGLEQLRDWFMEGQFDLNKQKQENAWEKSLRKKLVNNEILLDKSFPDRRIDQAYIAAEVDSDRTEFVWGTPDLDRLRTFLMSTVGWSQERVDQVLVPLIRDLNKKRREGTQSTLGEFYDVENMVGVKRKRMNKRMDTARAKMAKRK